MVEVVRGWLVGKVAMRRGDGDDEEQHPGRACGDHTLVGVTSVPTVITTPPDPLLSLVGSFGYDRAARCVSLKR